MHGVAPHMCDQVVRPLLDQGAGGRSPGFPAEALQMAASRGRDGKLGRELILRMRGDGCFARTANDARRYRFFDAADVRVASRNVSGTISCQEYEWDIAGSQSIGDPESHFARKLKIERSRRLRAYSRLHQVRHSRSPLAR
jgi:hypothetical protein